MTPNMKYLRYGIALAVFALYGLLELYAGIGLQAEYLFLAAGFLTMGIPHGALDHLLQRDKKNSLFIFIAEYVFVVVVYFMLWLFFPLFSLLFFLLFSAFHFGESEYEAYGIQSSSLAYYVKAVALGLSILFFIIATHWSEATDIILSYDPTLRSLIRSNAFHQYINLVAVLSYTYLVLQVVLSKGRKFIGLLFMLSLGIPLPLALSFGLYFVLQHSWNAWLHMKKELKLSSWTLYKEAIPYTLGAICILSFIFVVDSAVFSYSQNIMSSIFTFLSCISLPHFLLMHLFYKHRKIETVDAANSVM
jgi:Brp/Blh family beta-carotene 15,15'-monooxygenase